MASKEKVAFRLAEEMRRLALLLDFEGFTHRTQCRIEQVKRMISFFRQNQ